MIVYDRIQDDRTVNKRAVHAKNVMYIFMRQQQQSDLYRRAQGGRTSLPSVGSITILSVDTIMNGLITNFQSIEKITLGDGIKNASHERNELSSQKLDVRFSRHLGICRAHSCLRIVAKLTLSVQLFLLQVFSNLLYSFIGISNVGSNRSLCPYLVAFTNL